MMRLTKRDKDTMLLMSSTGDVFYISTFNYNLKRVLEHNTKKLPEHFRFIRLTKEGCATYSIDKPYLSVKFTNPSENSP